MLDLGAQPKSSLLKAVIKVKHASPSSFWFPRPLVALPPPADTVLHAPSSRSQNQTSLWGVEALRRALVGEAALCPDDFLTE